MDAPSTAREFQVYYPNNTGSLGARRRGGKHMSSIGRPTLAHVEVRSTEKAKAI